MDAQLCRDVQSGFGHYEEEDVDAVLLKALQGDVA